MAINKLRKGGAVAVASAATLFLAACAGAAGAAEELVPADAPAAETEATVVSADQCVGVEGTVSFRWWGGDTRAALTMEALDLFHELYPGITVLPQSQTYQGYWDQLSVEAIAGNTPDLFGIQLAWLPALVNGGVVADIHTLPQMDLSGYLPESLGAATLASGGLYATPNGGNALSMMVNMDVLAQVGIELPDEDTWTWEEYMELSQQIADAGLVNHNGDPIWGSLGMSRTFGSAIVWANQTDGGLFTADGQLNWTVESMEAFIANEVAMIESGAAPAAAIALEFAHVTPEETLMGRGQLGFSITWSNQMPAIASGLPDTDFRLIRLPGDFAATNIGSWINTGGGWAQSANSAYPEATACLMNFMITNEDAARIMLIDRGVPVNYATQQVVAPYLTGRDAIVIDLMGRLADGGVAPTNRVPELSDDLESIMQTAIDLARFGADTPAGAAATLHSDLLNAIVG